MGRRGRADSGRRDGGATLRETNVDYDETIEAMRSRARPGAAEGMKRFGINPEKAIGVPLPELRKIAKRAGTDRALARKLWASGIHDARILASMVEDPERATEAQMDRWVKAFASWDVCDECCMNLFWKTEFAYPKAVEWSRREREFEKRAGFALMAVLAWKDKEAPDARLEAFLPIVEREATDERNFVRKAVNWALRQIGKRNLALNRKAVRTAKRIAKLDSKAARWIARDALRELEGEAVQARLRR